MKQKYDVLLATHPHSTFKGSSKDMINSKLGVSTPNLQIGVNSLMTSSLKRYSYKNRDQGCGENSSSLCNFHQLRLKKKELVLVRGQEKSHPVEFDGEPQQMPYAHPQGEDGTEKIKERPLRMAEMTMNWQPLYASDLGALIMSKRLDLLITLGI